MIFVPKQRHLGGASQRFSVGLLALAGLPDGAGLEPMDPAEVPNQLESRRRAAATTSQLFSAVEDGAPKEYTVSGPSGILSF